VFISGAEIENNSFINVYCQAQKLKIKDLLVFIIRCRNWE